MKKQYTNNQKKQVKKKIKYKITENAKINKNNKNPKK
jgi:hypothetical protein